MDITCTVVGSLPPSTPSTQRRPLMVSHQIYLTLPHGSRILAHASYIYGLLAVVDVATSFSLTHIPTGLRLASFDSRDQARDAAVEVDAVHDWRALPGVQDRVKIGELLESLGGRIQRAEAPHA
jgi:hypothetical protein